MTINEPMPDDPINAACLFGQDHLQTLVQSLSREIFPELFELHDPNIGGTPGTSDELLEDTGSACPSSDSVVVQDRPCDYLFFDPFTLPLSNLYPQSVMDTSSDAERAIAHNTVPDTQAQLFSPVVLPSSGGAFDVHAVRKDFPILSEKVHGKDLVWFDNAATTQKPRQVIERLKYFYEHENSNVHRGAHALAARTTDAYEGARQKIASFLNAKGSNEIVFTRGTTEAINLVAHGYGLKMLHEGDEIVVTQLEHHANIVPWQLVCEKTGAKLRVAPVDKYGQIIISEYEKVLSCNTKLVAFTHVSNALGTVTPAAEMVRLAHTQGAKVLVDGAQALPHMLVDVRELDCDFYVFSGHKLYGPLGIGVLYGKAELLNSMAPYQGGGNMISDVTFERTTYQLPPHRFEAGTTSIADAIGLGAAIDYVQSLGTDAIFRYEHTLLEYGRSALETVPGLTLIGSPQQKASILSFTLPGFTTEEIGKLLDREGIAIRAGHHCAQPILRHFGLSSTARVSLAFYNTKEEIDFLMAQLRKMVHPGTGR